jgi:hypothetical protein
MGLNLHGIVRAAIAAVNPDVLGQWLESTGSNVGADYRPAPAWSYHDVRMQVQALSGKELQHPALLAVQGVKRGVYLFGTVQGVSKPQVKGGDILQFAMVDSGPLLRWLVITELEQWNPAGAWSKVAVVLQTDAATNLTPDVVGETLAAATTGIVAAGFVLGDTTDANSDTVPLGDIISQTPDADTPAVYGAAVDLVVSLGPEVVL